MERRFSSFVRLFFGIGGLFVIVHLLGSSPNNPKTSIAFVSRDGARFKIAVLMAKNEFAIFEFISLKDAMQTADEWGYRPSYTAKEELVIEHAWVEKRNRNFVVLWKVSKQPQLNQMTFTNSSDAGVFHLALRKGSYTPSPFGHAILLTRKL